MKHIFLIVLLGLVMVCPALAQNKTDEQELIRLDREWGTASMKGDAAFLNSIYADDYSVVTAEGTRNKQQVIEATVKDAAAIKSPSYASDNYVVRFIGNDTAIMTHTGIASGIEGGKPFNDPHRSIHVWVKRNGRWQVFSTFAAPLDDQQVLRQLERDSMEASKRRDTAWMERHLTDDYTWTSPDGTISNKVQDIANSKYLTFDSFDLSDMQVRVYGDTAVVTGVATIKGKFKDQDISGAYRFTDTFVKRDGEWKIAAAQASRIVQQSAAK